MSLVRGDAASLTPILTQVGSEVTLAETKACCRCHFVTFDPNGRPRVDALVEKLARQVSDYCIPRSRIAEAAEQYHDTGSTEAFSALEHEARELFVKLDKSGEGGELLLYLLLETLLGLPQLLCKMPLKTSAEMHVHGVDGVHGKLLPSGNLALYWGESKLYTNVNQAIDACFDSIAPYLLDQGAGAAQRDLLLVRDHIDPGDEDIKQALLKYFDDSEPESARIEFRGASLVGFTLENYPNPLADDGQSIRTEIAEQLAKWHQHIGTRVGAQGLQSFELEVFCVPLPSVDAFRQKLRERIAPGERVH
jgi:Cap4 SAVED domain